MPRFFVETLSPLVVITGDDARHISRSLRMRAGEAITLSDGAGNEADGVIASLSDDAVSVRLGDAKASPAEPKTAVSLYLAMPKGDKLELVVQKAVELGAVELVLVLTSRCISRPKGADAEKKLIRLSRIAREAAGQSGRGIIPAVRGVLDYGAALSELEGFDCALVLYEGDCPPLRGQLPPPGGRLALLVGSEGGFSPEEIECAASRGVSPASLGKRILRCETAPIAALSAVLFSLGEMD